MNRKIKIGDRFLYYSPARLITGQKVINPEIARDNLLLLHDVLNETEIKWGLMWGTLLGAIREKDFIAHDEDTDIFVFAEDKNEFLELLFKFDELGFKVIRYEGDLLSLSKNGEHIDIYFFYCQKSLKGALRVCGYHHLPAKWIEEIELYEFQGELFPIPSNYIEIFEFSYGEDWKIPKKEGYDIPHSWIDRLRFSTPSWIFKCIPLRLRAFLSRLAIFINRKWM